ncbi:hypothetical protein VTN96DRAFT_5410 [Rasamsonia emersonii]|uniref:Uncharacterized protein n=1 Tax=Rasamsonia emersonii (strain ATCC 16479 / CBS 393.64 / IMI 116815) TaxID=1408163 RepID=A0A0F4Z2U9_RASE3|nr:hypothetical protein T310_1297 [Rasamsonia emersonii CBS 393.64]KKA24665.1 hypothetical protein T310_1297 [Rasamsonia emersonii CBS 393.64]
MRRRYPIQVDELDHDDVKLLTRILRVDPTSQRPDNQKNRQMIARLPSHLHSSTLMKLVCGCSNTAVLCPTHKDLNRQVVRHAFTLLQQEVTWRLDSIEKHPGMVGPEEAVIIRYLRTIQGMWTAPPAGMPSPRGTWTFQIDKCEACMLARVGSTPRALRDLRTVLLSRQQARTNNIPPRLLRFVEEWINQHEDMKQYIYQQSNHQAWGMKEAREYAVRASHQKMERQIRQVNQPSEVLASSGSGHANTLNEVSDTEHERHNSRRDKSKLFCSGDGAADWENEIIDAYAATPQVSLTLEQQLGPMNLTPWPGNADPAAASSSAGTVSDRNRNSHQSGIMGQLDGAAELDWRHSEFRIYPAHSSRDGSNHPPDEFHIFVTRGKDSDSRSEYTDVTPPGTPPSVSPAETT